MRIFSIFISLLSIAIIGAHTSTSRPESKTLLEADSHKVYLPLSFNQISERTALMALHNSTNGPNWTENAGWGVGDPCDDMWDGVICVSGSVQGLDLNRNQLSGPIPPELGNLRSLDYLNLGYNHLSGEIPPELGYLRSLDYLNLGYNHLSGEIPSELGNLSNLSGLTLEGNQLSGSIPSELGNLNSLGRLNLSYNQLSGPIPDELRNLSNIGYLSLDENPSLWCWETVEARNWALSLNDCSRGICPAEYRGPDAVCPS